jgi:hypothetical protein
MDTSVFEQIASSLTVKSICSPLGPDVPASIFIADLDEYLDPGSDPNLDPWNNPSRVINNDGDVVGMLWHSNYAGEEYGNYADETTIDEVMERVEPYNEYLSSATTILDAVDLFGTKRNEYFYVTHVNEIVGVLRYSDLLHPLGRLAFLALALEIEDHALKLCQSASINEKCWLSLPDHRKHKAIELFKLRYGREPKLKDDARKRWTDIFPLGRNISDIGLLIECTNLVDKATMIWNQKLITAATRADVLGFFKTLRIIRDRCAHPGGEEAFIPREGLAHFVNSAKSMRSSLRESMQTHGVGSRKERIIIHVPPEV